MKDKVLISDLETTLLQTGFGLRSSGSRAKIDTVCALSLIVTRQQVTQIVLPASKRATVGQLWDSVRVIYGGDNKNVDRLKYDSCSLAIHLHRKLIAEHQLFMINLAKKDFSESLPKLSDTVVAALRWQTIDDLKFWVGLQGSKKDLDGARIIKTVADNITKLTEEELATIKSKVEIELKFRSSQIFPVIV